MNKISLLMIIERFAPLTGGAETQCQQLSNYLVSKGVSVRIVTKRWKKDYSRTETISQLAIHRLGIPGIGRLSDYLNAITLAFFLWRVKASYNILFINGGLANNFGAAAILIGRLLSKKVVCKVETPGELYFSGPQALDPKKYVHWLIRLRLSIALKGDYYIAQTKQVKKELVDLGISSDQIVEFPNAIDEKYFVPVKSEKIKLNLRQQLSLPVDTFLFTFCGRLVNRKGLVCLVTAFRSVTKATLVIIGSGKNQPDSVEDEIQRLVTDSKLTNILFVGEKNHAQLLDYLQASDCFVYPSIKPEGTALSVLEAMGCGLPIVVSDIGGLNEVVDGKNGFLAKPDNIADLSTVLKRVIDNPSASKKIGCLGRQTVLDRYSITSVGAEYYRFFAKIVSGKLR